MYLKRIKVRNFKSFAGATELPFQPGFTGVAGPNGMGKSNISDSILFVLGPTSSKALRADRLTHLFFNGGSSKKPATECEVSLVFDNQDQLLPVNAPEVEITRYVKLAPSDPNGYYSYFYVNGKRTTQTEIDAILSHARLSGDGYNLVQQGDVNKIVSMGPIPRRGLVERLAGISQYDEELERAETKRTDLDTNLDRINTLLTEIRNRISALESQRLQAIQYRQIQEEKRRAEAQLARAGHLLARQEVTTCEKQLAQLTAEIEKLKAEAGKLTEERDTAAQAIDAAEKEIARQGGESAAKFKQELDDKRLAFAKLDQNLQSLQETLQGLDDRIHVLSEQVKADEKDAQKFETQQKTLAGQLEELAKKADAQARDLKSATGDAEQSQGKLVGTRKQVLELERQYEAKQKGWQEIVQRRESAKASLDAADRSQAQAEEDHRDRELELKDLELRIKQTGAGPKGAQVRTADLQKEFSQLKSQEKELTAGADRLAQEVAELNRRYLALDARLKARAESGSRATPMAAVDFLLSQRNLGKLSGIRGTVEELAQFDAKFQTALNVAGGSRFQALVVETDQVAEECIKLLKAEKRGRATFLPLNKMLPGRPHGKALIASQAAGTQGFALDCVHFDESLRPAFWYVFGETVIMDELSHARAQMGGVRLVTLGGDLIEATGAISGGYLDAGEKGRGGDTGVELKRLGEELRTKSAAESTARQTLQKAVERIRSLGEELTKRSVEDEAHQSTRDFLDGDLASARDRLKEAKERVDAVLAARDKAESTYQKSNGEADSSAKELARLKEQLSKIHEEYLGHLPGALSARLRELQEASQATADARVKLNGELESVRASLAALLQNLSTHRSEVAEAKQQSGEKRKELLSVTKGRDSAKEALEALKTVESQQSETVKAATEKKRKLDGERLKIVEKLARAETQISGRQTMLDQEQIRLATAQQRLTEVEAALKEFPEPAADEKPVAVDELKRTITTLGAQLDSMGSVNLRALEEYDQEKGRLDEFQSEAERLSSEKKELLGLVGEIEKKKREKIGQVVVSVNTAFKEIYGELSGGGIGEIALESPQDPLAGGLLIRASPVGKTVERLEQLSGGEKSLASLAFIFSLQRYDPSPLYVFDEVDMSLDGLNAENVGRMLRRNSERAQFIVISLRKVTLKFAHRLFGVTMHGDGCSRVVGLNLDEIVDIDEHDRLTPATPAPAPMEAR
jgi:chromosome segregation protein